MRFLHPEPPSVETGIYPVFIPFAGCATRCVFCSQEMQTGLRSLPVKALEDKVLEDINSINSEVPVELAFYGGTFTALPQKAQEKWLRRAMLMKEQGRITSVRCSTRPDAITPESLDILKELGLETVELGIQSFADNALNAARRGYNGNTAQEACRMVQRAGLRLGVQLMPGMPGQSESDFKSDIAITLDVAPQFVRLYPCLVLRDTILATLWENGDFTPWSLEQILNLLPEALLALWKRGIRVIRMGLAPQAGMEAQVLAGPAHPALGQCLRSRALFMLVAEKLKAATGESEFKLLAPKRLQGEFFGHRGELKPAYEKLGLTQKNVSWHDDEAFTLLNV